MNKREATALARKIARTNTALWNAICLTEDLMNEPAIRKLTRDILTEDEEMHLIRSLVNACQSIKKTDELISTSRYESFLQEFDDFANILNVHLENEE